LVLTVLPDNGKSRVRNVGAVARKDQGVPGEVAHAVAFQVLKFANTLPDSDSTERPYFRLK
jgi:hypothetical protein